MNPHVYLLALLIGSSTTPRASPSAVPPSPIVATFLVQPGVGSYRRSEDGSTNTYHSLTIAAPHDAEYVATASRRRCHTSRRSSSLTRVDARRGGRGRRRGMPGSGEPASATTVAHRPNVTAAAVATLAVQHAATEELLEVAYAHRGVLRPGVLSQALENGEGVLVADPTEIRLSRSRRRRETRARTFERTNCAKHLIQDAKETARAKALNDPRLLEIFLEASAPAVPSPNSSPHPPPSFSSSSSSSPSTLSPSSSPLPSGRPERASAGGREVLSGPQAADIVWACGLLRWVPGGVDGQARLARLVEFVARAASSKSSIDDWNVTNVVWAIDRLGVAAENAVEAVPPGEGEEDEEGETGGVAATGGEGRGGARFLVGTRAIEELRERVERLPFRAIPSLFEGLRVEDFREEVAFGRDEILLGGGKVLSESRLTAWQSSDGLPFAYSGKVMESSPFSPNVLRLRDALYARTGILYDGVLLNLYESRTSAMRYHSDPDVGTVWTQDTSVVSVGDTRQFALRETLDHSRRHAFYLSSGDCVRMTAGCQRDYQHCIKVAKEDVGARVSLVFKQSIAGQKL